MADIDKVRPGRVRCRHHHNAHAITVFRRISLVKLKRDLATIR